jgi:hypothetical protein
MYLPTFAKPVLYAAFITNLKNKNMNAKEKAKELYSKILISDIMNMTKYCAKQCALIAVEEIINHH